MKTNVIHNSLQSNTAKLRFESVAYHAFQSTTFFWRKCSNAEWAKGLLSFCSKTENLNREYLSKFLGYLLQCLGSGCRIGGFENQLKGLTIPTGLTCQDFQTCLFTRILKSEAFFKVNTRECSESFEDVKKHKIYQNEYVLSSSLLDFVLVRNTAYIRVQRKCAIFI